MMLNHRKLGLTLVLLYIVCTIFAAYVTFSLPDELLALGAIGLDQVSAGESAFLEMTITMSATLLLGLGSLVFLLNNKAQEVIYVEKKREDKTSGDADGNEDDAFRDVDIPTIREIAKREKNDESKLIQEVLNEVCKEIEAGLGAFYISKKEGDIRKLEMTATYALALGETKKPNFEFGEGLVGQAASEEKSINIDDIPDGYIKIVSGLGSSTPNHLLVFPIKIKDTLYGVVEIASFTSFDKGIVASVEKAFEITMEQLAGDTTGTATGTATRKTSKTPTTKKGSKEA